VSFVLLLHFFALAVAATSNWNPSELALRLRGVPGVVPYLRLLALDDSYVARYYLTYGESIDVDHSFQIQLPDQESPLDLPAAEMQPGLRRLRYERLARRAVDLVPNTDMKSLVPSAVVGQVMKEHGATSAVVRCRGHFLQSIDAVDSLDAQTANPDSPVYLRSLFEATALASDDGSVDVIPAENESDVAPASAAASP